MAASPGKLMGSFINLLFFFVCGCLAAANEQHIFTHIPSYMQVTKDVKSLRLSEVSNLVLSSYGYSLRKDMGWNGLTSSSLFKRPKANVIFSIDGFSEVPRDSLQAVSFHPLEVDDYNVDTQPVADKLHSTNESPLIVDFSTKSLYDIKAENPGMFDKLSPNLENLEQVVTAGGSKLDQYDLGTLNVSNEADKLLLGEVHIIHELISGIKKNSKAALDKSPDFFHFHMGGLKEILSSYDLKSLQTKYAASLLCNFLNKMGEEFKQLYSDNIIIQVIATPASKQNILVRKARSLMADDDSDESFDIRINLAEQRDPNYPVIFNIILWMGIVLGVALIMIAYGMWNMDPGRDSIIYRMTSQRMKKD